LFREIQKLRIKLEFLIETEFIKPAY
jgi:hypothetical protein